MDSATLKTQRKDGPPFDAAGGYAKLTECEREVLDWLRERFTDKWARPMDVGGCDGSHHSYTLKKLVRLGYAEARRRKVSVTAAWGSPRAGREYRALSHTEKADRLEPVNPRVNEGA